MNQSPKTSPNRQRKIDIVGMLEDRLKKAKAFFVTEYRGMTHKQLEELRKKLKKVEAEFIIAKNRLSKIALKSFDEKIFSKLETEFTNPTATLFVYGDEINAIKELANFIKNVQLPKIKAGWFNNTFSTNSDFQRLAVLPSRNILLTNLAMRLKSPIYGLHYALTWNLQKLVVVLNNVKDKKGN